METEEAKTTDGHLTSAAAFVEGGIQDGCDDACSICLEEFTKNDPSTVTNCKHEFHLQCALEWCQRSSQCPMCWQPISLKDSKSQELLEAVEQERNLRMAPSRSPTIFHHPVRGGFDLPMGANRAEMEERFLHHLAAAMGRTHRIGRRESNESRLSAHGSPHFLLFSTHPDETSSGFGSLHQIGQGSRPTAVASGNASNAHTPGNDDQFQQIPQSSSVQNDGVASLASGFTIAPSNQHGTLTSNRILTGSESHPPNEDRAGPSDLQSFSETLRSRLSSMSMRYKESISKSTRGWKERLFSRGTSMAELGSEVRREVNAGIASVSRMMERLETGENRSRPASVSHNSADHSVTEESNQNNTDNHRDLPLKEEEIQASCAASSGSH